MCDACRWLRRHGIDPAEWGACDCQLMLVRVSGDPHRRRGYLDRGDRCVQALRERITRRAYGDSRYLARTA